MCKAYWTSDIHTLPKPERYAKSLELVLLKVDLASQVTIPRTQDTSHALLQFNHVILVQKGKKQGYYHCFIERSTRLIAMWKHSFSLLIPVLMLPTVTIYAKGREGAEMPMQQQECVGSFRIVGLAVHLN